MAVKVLYLTDANLDYLSDDLLYGLRTLLGADVVDYPRKEVLYRNARLQDAAVHLYGGGFHCFGLEDIPVDRSDMLAKITHGYFDAIVNSSAWRIRCPRHPQLVAMDGEDHVNLNPRYVDRVTLYFKRELLAPRTGVEPILFALPDFLRDDRRLPRTKSWHASFRLNSDIRREVARRFPPQYLFQSWDEYLADVKQSWFALSPKGAGYDCQRHYEVLGQAVLCIYMDASAPWLLRQSFTDNRNCLTFKSVPELVDKIERCTDPERLIEQAHTDLAQFHLASKRAEQLLDAITKCDLGQRRLDWWSRLEWRYWLTRHVPRHSRLRNEHGTQLIPAERT